MLLHLNYYQIACDTCGKQVYGKTKTEVKEKWQRKGGFYIRGNKCFCCKQCYDLYYERLKNETNHGL